MTQISLGEFLSVRHLHCSNTWEFQKFLGECNYLIDKFLRQWF